MSGLAVFFKDFLPSSHRDDTTTSFRDNNNHDNNNGNNNEVEGGTKQPVYNTSLTFIHNNDSNSTSGDDDSNDDDNDNDEDVEYPGDPINYEKWKRVRSFFLEKYIRSRILGDDDDEDDDDEEDEENGEEEEDIDDEEGENYPQTQEEKEQRLQEKQQRAIVSSNNKNGNSRQYRYYDKRIPPHVNATINEVSLLSHVDMYTKYLNLDLCLIEKIWRYRDIDRYKEYEMNVLQRKAYYPILGYLSNSLLPRMPYIPKTEDGPLSTVYRQVISFDILQLESRPTPTRRAAKAIAQITKQAATASNNNDDDQPMEGDEIAEEPYLNQQHKEKRRIRCFFYNDYAKKIDKVLEQMNRYDARIRQEQRQQRREQKQQRQEGQAQEQKQRKTRKRTRVFMALKQIPACSIFPFPVQDWYSRQEMIDYCICIGDISKLSIDDDETEGENHNQYTENQHIRFDSQDLQIKIAFEHQHPPEEQRQRDRLLFKEYVIECKNDKENNLDCNNNENNNTNNNQPKINHSYSPSKKKDTRIVIREANADDQGNDDNNSLMTTFKRWQSSWKKTTSLNIENEIPFYNDGNTYSSRNTTNHSHNHRGAGIADITYSDKDKNINNDNNGNREKGAFVDGNKITEKKRARSSHLLEEEEGEVGAVEKEDSRRCRSRHAQITSEEQQQQKTRESVSSFRSQSQPSIVRNNNNNVIRHVNHNSQIHSNHNSNNGLLVSTRRYYKLNEIKRIYEQELIRKARTVNKRYFYVEANVYGVVLGFSSPSQTKRGDWMINISLVDDTIDVWGTESNLMPTPMNGTPARNVVATQVNGNGSVSANGDQLRKQNLQQHKEQQQDQEKNRERSSASSSTLNSSSSPLNSTTAIIFCKRKEQLPKLCYAGDVLRLHRVGIQKYNGDIQLSSKPGSSFLVCRAYHQNTAADGATTSTTIDGQRDYHWDYISPSKTYSNTHDNEIACKFLWTWGQNRLSKFPTMKTSVQYKKFKLSDIQQQQYTAPNTASFYNTNINDTSNQYGDITVMVVAIIPVPPNLRNATTPRGFLRVWDGTGSPISDPNPIMTPQACQAMSKGDPPPEVLIKISSIIPHLQEFRRRKNQQQRSKKSSNAIENNDSSSNRNTSCHEGLVEEPPKAVCGRVVNATVWEDSHWSLVSKNVVKVGTFIRLRNVSRGVLSENAIPCLMVHEKSWLTPLPDMTYEVLTLLEEHSRRIRRNDPINPQSGLLPLHHGTSSVAMSSQARAPTSPSIRSGIQQEQLNQQRRNQDHQQKNHRPQERQLELEQQDSFSSTTKTKLAAASISLTDAPSSMTLETFCNNPGPSLFVGPIWLVGTIPDIFLLPYGVAGSNPRTIGLRKLCHPVKTTPKVNGGRKRDGNVDDENINCGGDKNNNDKSNGMNKNIDDKRTFAYRFGVRIKDCSSELDAIVSNLVAEAILGVSATDVCTCINDGPSPSTAAFFNLKRSIVDEVLWKAEIQSVIVQGSKFFILKSLAKYDKERKND